MNAIRGEHCLFRIFAVMRVGIFFVARVMKLRMLVGLAGSIAVGAEAQSVLFDFENAPPNHAVPFNLTVGGFQFRFTNTPGRSFTVFGITNLSVPFSNWTALSGLTETAPGQFQFTDSQATNHETRFYRVRAP